jgi:hypothetical protein
VAWQPVGGRQRSRHQNLGRWSTKRPKTGHQLHTCSCIITGGRRATPDGLMDGCSKRVMGVAVPRDPSIRNLVSSSQGSPPERDTHGHGRHQCSSSQPALLGHCRLSAPVASNNAIVHCKFACTTCSDEIERGKKEYRHQGSNSTENSKSFSATGVQGN